MILEKETFEAFEYYPSKLTHGSAKPILAACDECGKVRKIGKYNYRDLCRSCVNKKHRGKYCDFFNEEYKRKIREQYGNSCFLCGKWEKDNGRALSVHHVNYDPSCGCDGAKCICVPLCHSCHMKTNGDRDYWQKKIIRLLAESDYFDTEKRTS